MGKPLRVLMVEDSEHDALLLNRELMKGGYEPEHVRVDTAGAMLAALREKSWDVILCDFRMPRFNGLEAIALLKENGIDVPLIIVSGAIGEEIAADCMRFGAHDYVMKDNLSRLVPAMERELREVGSRRQRKQAEEALRESELHFKMLFERAPLGYQSLDMNGNFMDVNQTWLDTLGYDREEVIGRWFGDFLAPGYKEAFKERFPIFKAQGWIHSEYEMMHKKGHCLFIAFDGRIGKDLHGNHQRTHCILKDITEQKQAEEELKDRESELAAIYANAPLIMVVVDREWTIRKTNAFAARFLGRAVGDMIHLRCGESFHCIHSFDAPEGCGFGPSCATCVLRLAAIDTLETGRSHHQVETILSFSDGGKKREAVFLLSTARLTIRGEHRTLVSMEDITERKRGEEALRRSEENFRHSLDDSPMGVRIVTEQGETLYANRAMLDLYGYDSLEELRTTPIRKRYTPESHADFLVRREKRRQGADVPMEYPVSIIRKDGELRHLNVFRKEVLWNSETQYQAIYRDITDRKRAEDQLRESNEIMHYIVKHDPNAIAVYDRNLRYIAVSNRYLQDYRVKESDIIGRHHYEVFPEMPQRWKDVHTRCMDGAIERNDDDYFERPDGSITYNSWECRPWYWSNGEIGGIITYTEVTTERKLAEEELRASRKQFRALAVRLQQIREEERLQIAREVHDEMGGGLTGLKMDLSRLLHAVGDAGRPEASASLVERIQVANASIDQMIQVVRRISTGLRPPVLDDLGLMAALEWQLSEFTNRTAIPHEFVTTFEDLDLERDKAVTIFRFFQEALTNVVRHSRATRVVVTLRGGGRTLFGEEELVLEIRDNGRGITEEEILNPDSLGLLGMKERVLAVGGKLSIQGEPGGGTTLVLSMLRKQGGAL